MNIFLLKIFLAPGIITICTLIGRKYGHMVGGIIVGLPLTSGPVALILALEHGRSFVEEFSKAILFGIILVAFFDLAYAYVSKRFQWAVCSIIGWVVYCIPAYFLKSVDFPIVATFSFVVLGLCVLICIFPKHTVETIIMKAPKWDIPVRICVATSMIFLLTYLSARIGPHFSGVIATFPVYSTIFGASTHFHYGSNAAIRLLKGILLGSFSFAVFFLIIGTTIVDLGIAVSFSLASAAALVLQFIRYKASVTMTRMKAANAVDS